MGENERYFIINNIKFGYNYRHCGTIPKLGFKFLHPRLEMTIKVSKTLCLNRSNEGKLFLPDKIGRTQLPKIRVFRCERRYQIQEEKGTCRTIMKIPAQ
jgi:hypothetical protein